MQRTYRFLPLIMVTLLACQAVSVVFNRPEPPGSKFSPPAGSTPTLPPARVTPPATPAAPDSSGELFSVRVHPDGGLFEGDQVSFEVIAEKVNNPDFSQLILTLPDGRTLEPYEFSSYGIGRRRQATLFWAWDTTALDAGTYELGFSVLPGGPTWIQNITLQLQDAQPPNEKGARWAVTESDCCLISYITGTDAERDLAELLGIIDQQAVEVEASLPLKLEEPIPIVLLPRVLGHGGFARDELSVSYLDRNYAGGSSKMVLKHEIVHYFDTQLGGEIRPTFLVEGLAVYLSGGHFKPEPLLPRAAALLDLDWYLPLETLLEDFYLSQHEISYLEAGALVEYMVARWGWEAFEEFYRDIRPDPNNRGTLAALNNTLYAHFGLTLSSLEEDYLTALRLQEVTPAHRDDVHLTVEFYNTVRRYQLTLDPSAHYLTAWLPDRKEMQARGIVADYLRRPTEPGNILIETTLVAADHLLRDGNYTATKHILESINAVLDSVPEAQTPTYGE